MIEERVQAEYQKLSEKFADIDANKLAVVDGLLQRAAFMKVQIENLEQEIAENGMTESWENGLYQKGVKRTAAAEAYIQLSKLYASINKQLTDLVPPAETGGDELQQFM